MITIWVLIPFTSAQAFGAFPGPLGKQKVVNTPRRLCTKSCMARSMPLHTTHAVVSVNFCMRLICSLIVNVYPNSLSYVVLSDSKIITRQSIVMKISWLRCASRQYLFEVKDPYSRKFLTFLSPLMVKKQVYASFSTVTSITIVQRLNFIKISISIFDFFQLLPSTNPMWHFLRLVYMY